MDAEQRKKLERLKAQAHIKEQKQRLQKNVLLQECLDTLSFYLIIEDEATLPIVMSTGKNIVECCDDVMEVAFDTYLVSVSTGKTIGIRH
ncbi:MAG: hypothetical protein K6A72_05885 [Lachnospiraceae bacterium]|nr:hypothetical protein [Lachnospiraceae bacterium]